MAPDVFALGSGYSDQCPSLAIRMALDAVCELGEWGACASDSEAIHPTQGHRVVRTHSDPRSINGSDEVDVASVFTICEDDLSGEQTRSLLAFHLQQMHANSPAGSVFALDLSGLKVPGVTVWSAWFESRIVSVGALREFADSTGELKSMRTHPDYVRRGGAAAILEHIIGVAKERGLKRLSLETGSGEAFEPALALYRKRGFKEGEAFADYVASPFNQFLHLKL
jgi:putative acetyltransferase